MKKHLLGLSAVAMSLMLTTGVFADAAQSRYFTDMNSQTYGFWAIDEVDALYEAGVANGIGDSKFGPELLMERGDFILLLDNAFDFPTINQRMYSFTDVDGDDYYYTAVTNARGNGIIDNSPMVYPENPIKRIEAFRMLYNTMSLYGCVGSNGSTDVSMYTDSNLLLNTTDRIAVGTLTSLGVVSGSNGEIKPYETVTRAEMAVMLHKAIEVYEAKGTPSANLDVSREDESNKEENTTPERLTATVEALNGEEVEIKGNEIAVSSGDGALADGDGSKLIIEGSKITTGSGETMAVAATSGAEVELTDVSVSVGEPQSKGVYIDEDSSGVITGSTVFARGKNSVAVDNAGDVDIKDSTIQSVTAEAITLYGGATADIEASDIVVEGSNGGIRVANAGGDNYDKAVINLNDVTFKGGSKGAAIYVDNANVEINISNVVLDGIEKLLNTAFNYSYGIREATIDLNLDAQQLEGSISGDEMVTINLNLDNGSSFKGQLNYENTVGSMNVELGADSTMELTGDCYVDAFVVTNERIANDRSFGEIITDKGASIYYNANNHANDYLNDGTYSLLNGGVLTPISGTVD